MLDEVQGTVGGALSVMFGRLNLILQVMGSL